MATAAQAHRATAVGLSGGLGVALPLAALAVTLPFEEAHELVSSGAAPFAVGAVAGVGVLALTLHIMERRSEPAPAGTMGGAAAAAQPEAGERPRAAKGVPVISRAANAMSDDEAWAELEAILAEDSPISCDPARSKDVYQIALEELARTQEHEAVPAAAPEAAASSDAEVTNSLAVAEEDGAEEAAPAVPSAAAPASPADTTGIYLALAASCGITAASAADRAASLADDDEARDAAMASLGGVSAPQVSAASATAGAEPVASVAAPPADPATAVLGEPAAASAASSDAAVSAAAAAAAPSPQEVWAQALAILAEEVEPIAQEVPRPRGAHFAPSAPEPQPVLPQVDGGISMQAHVDELVEEEFNRMRSRSSRRSGRPSLRVIQGGTTGVQPRLSAEA